MLDSQLAGSKAQESPSAIGVFKSSPGKSSLNSGHVTLPSEKGLYKEMAKLARTWGADAIRDCDGTELDDDLLALGLPVYSTICLVRADQELVRRHPEYRVCKYLMSEPVIADSQRLEIDLMAGYFPPKYEVNWHDDPKKWWEIIDRTTGEVLCPQDWDFDSARGTAVIKTPQLFHKYTVNFLVYQSWDSTSMYNHIVNNWQKDKVISVDPYLPEARRELFAFFDRWLEKHKHTEVVRLTTLAYHFTIDSDENGRDKYRDWLGYTDCVSVKALEDFEKQIGYRLRPEHLVDGGHYNSIQRVPSKEYLDWMSFIQAFVAEFGKALVDRVHAAGKKAALFWGDHWIGTEPYAPVYQQIGADMSIGACEDGVSLRRLADAPGPQLKEIRLYPYLFPDVFSGNNDPVRESRSNWVKIRRAMLRKPVDRIGYGGYPSLALKYPKFIEHVSGLCDEFRAIREHSRNDKPFTLPIKVAVLDAWGKIRSWMSHIGPDQKFHCIRADTFEVSGSNVLECLSGLPVNVQFIGFDDIRKNGIPADVNVIINDGAGGTAWSGGDNWKDPVIVASIRKFTAQGGGFIGIGEPALCPYQARLVQLDDILGIEKETGTGIGTLAKTSPPDGGHFILSDCPGAFDGGCEKSYMYLCSTNSKVLAGNSDGHIHLATNQYFNGRGVYFAALKYSPENSRVLLRSILWAAGKERQIFDWFSSNPLVDCAYFGKTGWLAATNIDLNPQRTKIYKDAGQVFEINLGPCEIKWFQESKLAWAEASR